MKNYYGSLCTELYELLHTQAPPDELEFYLSYAKPGHRILEALCGSGRFLIPFAQRGFAITGFDLSPEMLGKLVEKLPSAKVTQVSIEEYTTAETFDYIFITSSSVSLFTDEAVCRALLAKMKSLLAPGGKFVFAVDTIANRQPDHGDYTPTAQVQTKEGYQLVLKCKSQFDASTSTQFSPSIYELYHNDRLLQREEMDFQTHLYQLGEMEGLLRQVGFQSIGVYSSFAKAKATHDGAEMFLYECQ